ncbi:plasminogen-like [Clavelina lepadiformis]|uniref:plasminogen-like n=1 Tax=Clavelina lepadiformis TaxID=159417 RepID=UPI00404319E0
MKAMGRFTLTAVLFSGLILTVMASCPELAEKCNSCKYGNVLDEDKCPTCECMTTDEIPWGSLKLTSDQADMLESLVVDDNDPDDDDDPVDAADGDKTNEAQRAVYLSSAKKRWNNDKQDDGFYRVPYIFGDDLENYPRHRELIQKAISAIYSQTCISFQPAEVGDRSIIKFVKDGGCGSFIGRRGNKIREITGCSTVGNFLRELMHALGVWKETSRPDRGNYVKIFKKNMKYDKHALFNRLKSSVWDDLGIAYDTSSVTNYGGYAFTYSGRPTIIDRSTDQPLVRNRWALSKGDLQQLRAMYECRDLRGINETTTCYSVYDYGLSYRGQVNLTRSGLTCENWDSQSPHKHAKTSSLLTASGLDYNYCRNPDMKDGPWCYTTDSTVVWEYCNVTECIDDDEIADEPEELESERGFWAPWSNYSDCSASCGIGYKYSTRRCIGNRTNCEGKYWRYKECSVENCTDVSTWEAWESWGACDVECGNGTRIRTRDCDGYLGYGFCIGNSTEEESCYERSCPVYEGGECYSSENGLDSYRGNISVTSDGTACILWENSNLNPNDYPTRNLIENFCRNPKDKDWGPYCFIAKKSKMECSLPACEEDASWGNWGNWSACSESCGVGVEVRTRACINGTYGRGTCVGDIVEYRTCNTSCDDDSFPVSLERPETRPAMTTTTPSTLDCVDIYNPRSYRGMTHETVSGYECQYWDSQYPWPHNYTDHKFIAKKGLHENFCRAPEENDIFPWCFAMTYLPTKMKEYCIIDICPYN